MTISELYNQNIENEQKKIFEANFLDGDSIQKGQMLSSDACFEAIKLACESLTLSLIEGEIKRIGSLIDKNLETQIMPGYTAPLFDQLHYLIVQREIIETS